MSTLCDCEYKKKKKKTGITENIFNLAKERNKKKMFYLKKKENCRLVCYFFLAHGSPFHRFYRRWDSFPSCVLLTLLVTIFLLLVILMYVGVVFSLYFLFFLHTWNLCWRTRIIQLSFIFLSWSLLIEFRQRRVNLFLQEIVVGGGDDEQPGHCECVHLIHVSFVGPLLSVLLLS